MKPKLHSLAAAAALLAGALAASPAYALFEDDEARKAIIDLRGRVELQNRDTKARLDELSLMIETRSKELAERLDRLEQMARGQLELQSQIDALRQEIAKLRGTIEVQTNELATTQRRQRELVTEIDARIKPFEPMQVQIDDRTVMVQPDEKRTFDGALAMLRAGEFAGALAGFQQLRLRWPETAYAPAAQFWTGTAQFALKDYKAAIATTQAFLSRYPEDARVPDAMLNLGLSQLESGDKRAARTTLQIVADRYAEAPAGRTASQRLTTIK